MKQQEKVLCIKRNTLPAPWVGKKSIIKTDEAAFFDICERAGFYWKERGVVETDPSFKQIIPYIVLQTADGKQTAIYRRCGSEKRLHDLWSVGIGGHINPEDTNGQAPSFKDILVAGMTRELDEELVKRPNGQAPCFRGTINEEATDVGSVHLGAVFTLLTETPDAFLPGEELKDFTWVDTDTLAGRNLELWSTFALELMG
jgi:predicted NUDIX family phosphoesterase